MGTTDQATGFGFYGLLRLIPGKSLTSYSKELAMNRPSFPKIGLASLVFQAAPFSALTKGLNRKGNDKGFRVEEGKDRFEKPISLFEGDRFDTKAATNDTEGDLSV